MEIIKAVAVDVSDKHLLVTGVEYTGLIFLLKSSVSF